MTYLTLHGDLLANKAHYIVTSVLAVGVFSGEPEESLFFSPRLLDKALVMYKNSRPPSLGQQMSLRSLDGLSEGRAGLRVSAKWTSREKAL